jgi:hypothetical protein
MPVSRPQIPRHVVTEKCQAIERKMRAYFVVLRTLGRTDAATPEELYGFRALEVSEMHFYTAGVGRGVWFRLKNGRVFDSLGRPSRRDRVSYSMRPPRAVRAAITLNPPVARIGKWTKLRERHVGAPGNHKTKTAHKRTRSPV